MCLTTKYKMIISNSYCVYLTIYRGNKLPPFYIGSSSIARLNKGYKGTPVSKIYKDMWLSETKQHPYKFKTVIIKTFNNRTDAALFESKIQKQLKVHSNPLYTNLGYFSHGHLVYSMSNEERKRISQQRVGYKHSSETRSKMSLSAKGRRHKESTKLIYRDGRRKGENNPQYGKALSEEHKNKIRLAQKGKTCPQRGRKGRIGVNKDKILSTSTKQKMSKYIWYIINPDGSTVVTEILADWCKQNNFRYDSVRPGFIKNNRYKEFIGYRLLKT